MQQQKLCLKWHNHSVNFLSEFQDYRQKDILVDVTITCEGRNIKAHKMILSACSPYFQNIFSENPCQHPIVIINGMKYEDIMSILSFMYKGEVNVSHEGLSSFLQAAEALKVKGLAEVCGEKKSATSNQEKEVVEPTRPPRTETPNKKRQRNRKRSFSDDEGGPVRKSREPQSPEIHELSGDESYAPEERSSSKQQMNSRRSQNMHSRSHPSSNVTSHEEDMDDDYEIEPSKLLEQTLTTENVSVNNSTDNSLRIDRITGNTIEVEPTSIQEPESPPDIKPVVDYGESSTGASEGNTIVFNEQSQPGPSNIQEMRDSSPTQGYENIIPHSKLNHCYIKKKIINIKKMKYECTLCEFSTWDQVEISKHLKTHAASIKIPRSPPVSNLKRNPTTYSCFQCSFKTESTNEISNHLLSHANSFHVCGICRRRFDSKAILMRHQNINHTNKNGSTKANCLNSPSTNRALSHKLSDKKIYKSVQNLNLTKSNPSQCEPNVASPISSGSLIGPVAQKRFPIAKDPILKSTMALKTLKSRKSPASKKKVVRKSTIFFVVDPSSSGSADKQSPPTVPQEETLHPCCYCDEVFASSFGLTCHKENIHKYKCSVAGCCNIFFDPAIFKAHMADHDKRNQYARK